MPTSEVVANALDKKVSTENPNATLQEKILAILRNHQGSMSARDLIKQAQNVHISDPESIRRALLRLSADGQTAYTSEWRVILRER